MKANFTPREVEKASAPKRKAPKARAGPATTSKKMKVDCESDVGAKEGDALSLGMEEGDILDTEAEYLSPSTGRIVSNQGTHTEYSKYVLSAKVETMVLRNEVATMKNDSKETTKIIANMSYENIKKDSTSMKHFVGLTTQQFEALYCFLDSVCSLNDIVYWNAKESTGLSKGNTGPDSNFSNQEKFFICLLRLRRGFTIKNFGPSLKLTRKKD